MKLCISLVGLKIVFMLVNRASSFLYVEYVSVMSQILNMHILHNVEIAKGLST